MSEPAGTRRAVKIHIRGHLDPEWSNWFEGMQLRSTEDETIVEGFVIDQSALYGILGRLRDLGLELLSIEQME